MKKILSLAAAAVIALTAQAQQTEQKALVDSKPWDNWYIGVFGGGNVKTTDVQWMKNLNALGGVRVGRWFTPCFGLVVDDQVGFQARPNATNYGTLVTYNTLDFGTTINFSNWFGGYKGEPRTIEVIGIPSLGWSHAFGNHKKFPTNANIFDSKLALDLAYNFGKAKEFQLYLEPSLLYNIYENGADHFDMDINRSFFQLALGFVYKFKNTNGTHNFKYAEPVEIKNTDRINELQRQYDALLAQHEALKAQSASQAKQIQPLSTNAHATVKTETAAILPSVFFQCAKSNVQKDQKGNIESIAKYMAENPDINIVIKGYASPEGNAKKNQKLSEERANAVADILVKKYGIAADRIFTEGCGTTSELFSERDMNRVAVSTVK